MKHFTNCLYVVFFCNSLISKREKNSFTSKMFFIDHWVVTTHVKWAGPCTFVCFSALKGQHSINVYLNLQWTWSRFSESSRVLDVISMRIFTFDKQIVPGEIFRNKLFKVRKLFPKRIFSFWSAFFPKCHFQTSDFSVVKSKKYRFNFWS